MGLIKKRKRVVGGTAEQRKAARSQNAEETARGQEAVRSDSESGASGDEKAPDTEEEQYETPDEKRVRLAKEYLSKVGEGKTEQEVQDKLDMDFHEKKLNTRAQIGEISLGEQRFFKGHKMAVTCVALNAEETVVFSGGKDCHVMRYDIETGVRDHFNGGRNKFDCGGHFSPVLAMTIVEPRNVLLSVGVDRVVRMWDSRAPRHTVCQDALLGHQGSTTGVAVEADGNTMYTCSTDKSLKVWDLRKNRCMDTLFGHVSAVSCLDLGDNKRPVTGGEDKTVRAWKTDQGTHLMFHKHSYAVDAVAVADNERFLSGSQDGNLHLWSSGSKKPLASLSLGAGKWITALRTIRRSNIFFGSAQDGLLRCWRFGRDTGAPKVEGVREDKALTIKECIEPIAVPGCVNGIAVGKKVIALGIGREHRLGRWDYNRSHKNGVIIMPLSYREVERKGPEKAKS